MFYACRGEDAFGNIMPHLSAPRVKTQSLYLAHPFRLVLLFDFFCLRRVSEAAADDDDGFKTPPELCVCVCVCAVLKCGFSSFIVVILLHFL